MKKILFLLLAICMFVACRKHVYHTYYGHIDIDTMLLEVQDGMECYAIKTTPLEHEQAYAMGLDSMWLVTYYVVSSDKYFIKAYGSDGGCSPAIMFNPEDNE